MSSASDDIELDELRELWAPHEALKPFFEITKFSPDHIKVMNESCMADLLGDDPVKLPPSELNVETHKLFYAIMEVYSPAIRFRVYKKMFGSYPWRNRISKSDHFQSVYYLFAHECYVFEERLGKLLDALSKFALRKKIPIDMKRISREIMKAHKQAFGTMVRWRGIHVHQDEFVPRDIKRISLLETMILSERLGKMNSEGTWKKLQMLAVNEAKKKWIEQCGNADRASRQILILTFRLTKPIWSRISEGIPQ